MHDRMREFILGDLNNTSKHNTYFVNCLKVNLAMGVLKVLYNILTKHISVDFTVSCFSNSKIYIDLSTPDNLL